ncbi:YfgM family protein [Acinetobacter larvae]|uniref:Ancillary SecYEG translocon subunit n=1 Tax=Acinetobacter larvae TaxID=1789224 RepID=A0A1B2M276_9GAMM|nr:tetratricopeptide repeat protein [Acinetobacter larvae]AOA59300.1 hypothetical protein BFG52_13675 [Acinetobacter larvae]
MSAMTENEQLDDLKSFLKKYGSKVLSLILVALIAFFAWQYWQNKNTAKLQKQTAKTAMFMDEARALGDQPDAKAFAALAASAESILQEDPDSVQALQAQLVMAKQAYNKNDYALAERILTKAESSKLKDEGLRSILLIQLADTQLAQKKFDVALKTLDKVQEDTFKATVDEARGDIYVAKNDIANAKKAYQAAWNTLIERKQERQILQIKLESVGVLVEDPDLERPILTHVDEL